MMWRTHLAGGIALTASVLLTLAPHTGQETLGIALLCGAFGSLLPDLDAADSKIRRFAPFFGAGKTLGTFRPLALPATVVHTALGHRGAFHSLLAMILVGAVAAGLCLAAGTPTAVAVPGVGGLTVGFLSHLLLDACTPHGVPFLLPFQRTRGHVLPRGWRVTTGSLEEDVALALLTTLCLALLLPRLMMSQLYLP